MFIGKNNISSKIDQNCMCLLPYTKCVCILQAIKEKMITFRKLLPKSKEHVQDKEFSEIVEKYVDKCIEFAWIASFEVPQLELVDEPEKQLTGKRKKLAKEFAYRQDVPGQLLVEWPAIVQGNEIVRHWQLLDKATGETVKLPNVKDDEDETGVNRDDQVSGKHKRADSDAMQPSKSKSGKELSRTTDAPSERSFQRTSTGNLYTPRGIETKAKGHVGQNQKNANNIDF